MSLFNHPIKKLTLAAVFGIGYTLGAKAGRERYEQIKSTAQQVKDDPRVQQATAQAEEFVRDTASKVKDDQRVHDVVERVEHMAGQASDDAGDAVKDVVDTAVHKVEDVAEQVTDTVNDVADKKLGSSETVADKVENVAKHAADTAGDLADQATDRVEEVKNGSGSGNVHPLLADQHVELDEEVVYSTGPDSDYRGDGRI